MKRTLFVFLMLIFVPLTQAASGFETIVAKIKPSVVGVGISDPMGSPRNVLQGTGFAVGDGTLIVTNFHVVEKALDPESYQQRVVFIGIGESPKISPAEIIKTDPGHDLAILKIKDSVPPLTLADDTYLPDGRDVAFTGFPIGAILGLYPATHRGMIAALTPVVIPSANAQQLSIQMMKRLKEPFMVYQMDATAYPGNSGSPVYDVESGKVVALINKVFVKETKESALSAPSGISYSIPVKYLHALMAELE
ncbi:S1C family serine protease [Bowmanella sp. Y26]|uniref:S1 family peptidase n=1 Tax=Bowmanella yangjiangensis TaxID=2811230 RepID=UPI001BDD1993|nr:serine protease [Bowmanella yangjiangensis]MBT1064864.1 S1C family serine protease [Bowmanella yangjiangensis]